MAGHQTSRAACPGIAMHSSVASADSGCQSSAVTMQKRRHIACRQGRCTFVSRACGALSVPRKNFWLPLMAAAATACR